MTFICGGSLKDTMYKTYHPLEKLCNICHKIAISWEELQRVNNVLHQYTDFSQEGKIFSICCSTGKY
jgi:hypothetical protein